VRLASLLSDLLAIVGYGNAGEKGKKNKNPAKWTEMFHERIAEFPFWEEYG